MQNRPHKPRRGRPSRWAAALIALIVGLLAFGAGAASVLARGKTYSATASLLVLPARNGTTDSVASLYDALSTGQIVQSFQAVMSSPGFLREAEGANAASASSKVTVVPATSLIDVTTTDASAAAAERGSDAIANSAVANLSTTFSPYRISLVSSATHTAKQTGTSSGTLLGLLALVAVIVALAVYQAARWLLNARAKRADGDGLRSPVSPRS